MILVPKVSHPQVSRRVATSCRGLVNDPRAKDTPYAGTIPAVEVLTVVNRVPGGSVLDPTRYLPLLVISRIGYQLNVRTLLDPVRLRVPATVNIFERYPASPVVKEADDFTCLVSFIRDSKLDPP